MIHKLFVNPVRI